MLVDEPGGLDPDYLALALSEGAEAGVTKETDGVGGKLGARHVEIDEAIAGMTVGTEREVAIGGEKGDPALAAKSAKNFVIWEPLRAPLKADLANRPASAEQALALLIGEVLVEEGQPAFL